MSSGSSDEPNSQRDEVALGRYRRLLPICQDTIGTTYLGVVTHGEDAGRQVLLTFVSQAPDSLAAKPLLAAAERELKLRHSAVLAFLDIEVSPSRILFVSEAMEGEPLSTLMATAAQRREPIAASIALRIVKEAVSSLRTLRQLRGATFAHGLLNPETLFVASCGEVLLRQPELKSAVLKVAGYRRHTSILPYQAPELLCDDREDEERGDVFSAGVLLWEMIAGRGLFGPLEPLHLGRDKQLSAGEAGVLKERVLSEKIPGLSSVVRVGGAVSPDVARLVDWMLCRDPSGRPGSLDELARVLDSLPPQAVATSAQVGQFVRRLLGANFEQREQLLVRALKPSSAPTMRPASPREQPFQEPQTTPRSLALAARLLRDVPPIEEEAPPAAVVPIFSEKKPARRDGLLALAAGILLALSLGGYLAAARTSAQSSAKAPKMSEELGEEPEDKAIPSAGEAPGGRSTDEPVAPSSAEVTSGAKPLTPSRKPPTTKAPGTGVSKPASKPASHVDSPRGGFRPSGI